MSLIQRLLAAREARFNELRARERYYQRRQLIAQTPRQSYLARPRVVEEPKQPEKKIPLFGQDPASAIGYSETRSSAPAPQGVVREGVARPTVNRSGSLANLEPAMTVGKTEIESETRGPLSYQPTDQKNLGHGGSSPTSNWDGVVRNAKTSSNSPLSFRQKSQPTPADLHERDLRNAPYDFSA